MLEFGEVVVAVTLTRDCPSHVVGMARANRCSQYVGQSHITKRDPVPCPASQCVMGHQGRTYSSSVRISLILSTALIRHFPWPVVPEFIKAHLHFLFSDTGLAPSFPL